MIQNKNFSGDGIQELDGIRLVILTISSLVNWVVGDTVQNDNLMGGNSGDDWTGVIYDIVNDTIIVIALTSGKTISDINNADGIDNTTRSDKQIINSSSTEYFKGCNFTQFQPNTNILVGKTGLTFERCNLVNCFVPGDATIISCNNTQISFCYHLHPEDYNLSAEPDNCPHVIDSDELIVDGETIGIMYKYKDTVL